MFCSSADLTFSNDQYECCWTCLDCEVDEQWMLQELQIYNCENTFLIADFWFFIMIESDLTRVQNHGVGALTIGELETLGIVIQLYISLTRKLLT